MKPQSEKSRFLFILNFHGLGEPSSNLPAGERDCWINPNNFSDILDATGGRKDVEITFDDANESDYTIALPLLKAKGASARFFLVAGRIGQPKYLSIGQVQELCAEGMSIGSHGMRHRRWGESNNRELEEELMDAREKLEQVVERPVSEAACPFGSYNRKVLRKLREAGYQRVYTSDGGPAPSGAWLQPRNTVVRPFDLKSVLRIVEETPSGARGIWRQFKLALKRWR